LTTHHAASAARIFLSYRREDTAGYAGRIAERLTHVFGDEYVFRDIEDIQPGVNFADEIQRNVAGCDVLIALIGPHWLKAVDANGKNRLDDQGDFVRIEIVAALQRGVRVIPVLVQKAEMPGVDTLPESLKPLAMHQAVELSDSRWDFDMGRLIALLSTGRTGLPAKKRYGVAIVCLLFFAAIFGWFYFRNDLSSASSNANVVIPARGINQGRNVQVAETPIDVTGRWIGAWVGPHGKEVRIRFEFESQGAVLMGRVRYPTGDGGIYDGKIDGDRILFVTRHTPQFEDKEVAISFVGRMSGNRIEFIMQRPQGAQRFTAMRAKDAE